MEMQTGNGNENTSGTPSIQVDISAEYRMEWSKPLPLCILFPGHHPALVTFSIEKQWAWELYLVSDIKD